MENRKPKPNHPNYEIGSKRKNEDPSMLKKTREAFMEFLKSNAKDDDTLRFHFVESQWELNKKKCFTTLTHSNEEGYSVTIRSQKKLLQELLTTDMQQDEMMRTGKVASGNLSFKEARRLKYKRKLIQFLESKIENVGRLKRLQRKAACLRRFSKPAICKYEEGKGYFKEKPSGKREFLLTTYRRTFKMTGDIEDESDSERDTDSDNEDSFNDVDGNEDGSEDDATNSVSSSYTIDYGKIINTAVGLRPTPKYKDRLVSRFRLLHFLAKKEQNDEVLHQLLQESKLHTKDVVVGHRLLKICFEPDIGYFKAQSFKGEPFRNSLFTNYCRKGFSYFHASDVKSAAECFLQTPSSAVTTTQPEEITYLRHFDPYFRIQKRKLIFFLLSKRKNHSRLQRLVRRAGGLWEIAADVKRIKFDPDVGYHKEFFSQAAQRTIYKPLLDYVLKSLENSVKSKGQKNVRPRSLGSARRSVMYVVYIFAMIPSYLWTKPAEMSCHAYLQTLPPDEIKLYVGQYTSRYGGIRPRDSHFIKFYKTGKGACVTRNYLFSKDNPHVAIAIKSMLMLDKESAETGEAILNEYAKRYNELRNTETFLVTKTVEVEDSVKVMIQNCAENNVEMFEFTGEDCQSYPEPWAEGESLINLPLTVKPSEVYLRYPIKGRDLFREHRVYDPVDEFGPPPGS